MTKTYCRALLTPPEEMNALGFTQFELFLDEYSKIFRRAEIKTVHELQSGREWSKSKWNTYLQKEFGINKRQANGIISSVKSRLDSAKECRKNHIKTLEQKLKSIKKDIKSRKQKIKSQRIFYAKKKWRDSKKSCLLPAACYIKTRRTHLQAIRFGLHHKQRRQIHLERQIESLNSAPIHVKIPCAQVFLVGSKDETLGNQVCQWDMDRLTFTVPYCLRDKFGTHVSTYFPDFKRNLNRLPVDGAKTWHFYRKDDKWIAACQFTPIAIETVSHDRNKGVIGIDDNPSEIGWAYIDGDGNLKSHGKIPLLQGLPRNKHNAQLVNACLQIYTLAEKFECPVIKEELDFSAKKSRLKESGRKYTRMLSGWAYSRFDELLDAILTNRGIELIRVNPAYTSVMGMVKYARQYGLPSSEAAAIAIGRRGMRLSERMLSSITALLDVKPNKHVWTLWNQLNKMIRSAGINRHDFYSIPSLTENLRSNPSG
ncbi:MAG: hypothetical protein AB4426_03250 [Xenococcaceae cyanobacterium]